MRKSKYIHSTHQLIFLFKDLFRVLLRSFLELRFQELNQSLTFTNFKSNLELLKLLELQTVLLLRTITLNICNASLRTKRKQYFKLNARMCPPLLMSNNICLDSKGKTGISCFLQILGFKTQVLQNSQTIRKFHAYSNTMISSSPWTITIQ